MSTGEVSRLIAAARKVKHQAALSVAYGAGLRASEVISLKITDVDSQRMTLRVEQGKGAQDRYALLSPVLLQRLRAWREAQRGHLSLAQVKVMSAIGQCRSAVLGGHVLRCGGCGADQVSYNSCRNRHCPKCQGSAAQRCLDARQADLLPVEYFHVGFTLPAPIADIALQNKTPIYGLLFDLTAEVLQTIAADPKHLGARIGTTLVLHTWGSALTHHPHVHGMQRLHQGGKLRFFGEQAGQAAESPRIRSRSPPPSAWSPSAADWTCRAARRCSRAAAFLRVVLAIPVPQPVHQLVRQEAARANSTALHVSARSGVSDWAKVNSNQ